MNFADNAVVRFICVLIAIAAGIRIIFWLLMPVMPYLAALVVAFTVCQLVSWYRGHW